MRRVSTLIGLLFIAAAASPRAALACAVCGGGDTTEASRNAFLLTTGFLSLLPILLIGSVVWFVVLKAREQAEKEAERDAARETQREAEETVAVSAATHRAA